jgi:hypothetical protein
VQIAPSSDLRVTAGWGTGHFTVRVTLANGRVATRLLGVSDYFRGRGRWTPWFGHAQIDHYRGQELLLGRTSGAHTQVYTVVTMRSGRLRVLDTPAGTAGWVVNSSWGTGAQGWACTNRGVMSRSAVPSSDHARFRIRRESFVLRLAWHRTSVMASTVAATSNGGMPTSVAHYGAFACRGLPQ